MSIGLEIKVEAIRRHITLADLAHQAGMKPEHISRIVNGHVDPRLSQVLAIADVLGIDAADLLARADAAEKKAA